MPRPGFPYPEDFTATPCEPDRAEAVLTSLAKDSGFTSICNDPAAIRLLSAVFGNSPFLGRVAQADRDFLPDLFARNPDRNLSKLLDRLEQALLAAAGMDQAMVALRLARRRVALLVALADLSGAWDLAAVTSALSRFADGAVGGAVRWLLRAGVGRGELRLGDLNRPELGCGLVVLGMGKLGANELNYSSDIDLIALYDGEAAPYVGQRTAQEFYIRLVRDLVKMLQQPTRNGYVLRTDLRLRPDPGVTPVVVAMVAAEQYYENLGQNWERAAMIKARAIAGDPAAGAEFLTRMQPFIWRRNLDYAAIADIHSIMRKIHSHEGDGDIAVEGHNVKLGRGGIRDIEFFAQTQQLIAGGREPALRPAATAAALDALARGGWIDGTAAAEMTAAYEFLRQLEHRLQMVADEQTQSMPKTAQGVAHMALFMGFGEAVEFRAVLLHHLNRVRHHHGILFDAAPERLGDGRLIFTGVDDDPDTLAKLAALGFEGAQGASQTVRGWHHGRYRAMRSARARELLTALAPALLQAFADTANPNATLGRFDRFLSNLPTGVQLFSMLTARPQLLELLAEIMGSAPRLANYLAENSTVVDAMTSAEFLATLPTLRVLRAEFAMAMDEAGDFQDVLDFTRRHVKERKFQIGAQILGGTIDADRSGAGYADLAEAAVAALLPRVADAFAKDERHGQISGGGMAVLAMGKLGSRELTGESDLDLIFVYDYPDPDAISDGARALPAQQYFSRLSQRLINALTVPTAEGKLYEVDMRLRPSGNSGPVATRFDGFGDYQRNEAWTWEHMALTRARVIAGEGRLVDRVEGVIADVLARPRDRAAVARDVSEMRQRLVKEAGRGNVNPWELKLVRGGLLDIEFIAQFLQLAHGAEDGGVLAPNTALALSNLARLGHMGRREADDLIAASGLYRDLMALFRVAVVGDFDPATAPRGLANAVLKITGSDDMAQLEQRLARIQADVLSLFQTIVEASAAGGPSNA